MTGRQNWGAKKLRDAAESTHRAGHSGRGRRTRRRRRRTRGGRGDGGGSAGLGERRHSGNGVNGQSMTMWCGLGMESSGSLRHGWRLGERERKQLCDARDAGGTRGVHLAPCSHCQVPRQARQDCWFSGSAHQNSPAWNFLAIHFSGPATRWPARLGAKGPWFLGIYASGPPHRCDAPSFEMSHLFALPVFFFPCPLSLAFCADG